MKKILFVITMLVASLIFCSKSYATESDNIALLAQKGFFEKTPKSNSSNPCEDVKKILLLHLKYSNTYNLTGLRNMYADNYINADGLNKETYFNLVQKTWKSYPDIKYKIIINNIDVNNNVAVAQVSEFANATTSTKSGVLNESGSLQSFSGSIYYLTKINDEWLVTSDYVIFEKTFLGYGSAKLVDVDFAAPYQVAANAEYTATLKLNAPKDCLVVGSIGQEKITYPQVVAEEIFRKIPTDGTLERIFKANDKNINEYAVASFGITKAEVGSGKEIKLSVTGLGFLMSRVNVVPKNQFIKDETNEKSN